MACVSVNARRERVYDLELAHGRVNRLLLEAAIDLELNLIVKTSILL